MPQLNASQLKRAQAKARKLGVTAKKSTRKGKKLDIFDKYGKKVASIGDTNYQDYLQHGDNERRRRYKARHNKYRNRRGTPSYYADKILW